MQRQARKLFVTAIIAGLAWQCLPLMGDGAAQADYGWKGKRRVSYQKPNDLFYNYYVGPEPSGTAAEMYVSPLPVPATVGHTYNTYQPFYPHEMLYDHHRTYHTHHPGAGWTRTKARYSASGNWLQSVFYKLHY